MVVVDKHFDSRVHLFDSQNRSYSDTYFRKERRQDGFLNFKILRSIPGHVE